MNSIGRPVDVDLAFGGVVNRSALSCIGRSRGAFGHGDISAVVDAAEVPPGMDISLLSYVALTGQPSMSRVLGGAINPFIRTGGVYTARRTLDLGCRGHLTTDYYVEHVAPDHLRAVFDVRGSVDVPRLISIAPTIETWTPTGPGRIDGQFTMVWTGEDGSQVQGRAATSYVLPTTEAIPGQQFRTIRIGIDSTATRLHQREHIVLFTPALLEQLLGSEAGLADAPDAAHLTSAPPRRHAAAGVPVADG